MADGGNNRIRKIVPSPRLSLEQPTGTSLQNSQTISFGTIAVGGSQSLTFTIKNTGTASLTGLYINNYGWDIQASSLPSDTLAPGGSMTFTATYTPYWGGQSSATIQIYSNDPSLNPFSINLTGTGLSPWMDSDGDGMNDVLEYSMSHLGFDWQVPQPALVSAYNIKMNLPFGELIATSGKEMPFELSALGGTGPLVWEKTAGNLPPGVTLGSNGTFTGTPTASGKYQFTLKVTNSQGFSATRQVTLRIIPNATFGGGYNFSHFAGRMFGFLGSGDSSSTFTGSGADSGGFTGSSDGGSSFTGSADFAGLKPAVRAPSGVAVDALGNIYVADSANNQVRKITANGTIQNLAGVFTGSGGKDGTNWNARFNNPQGMTCDTAGNIYVADQGNHAIRKITASGTVSTVAGSFTGSGAAAFSGSANGGAKTAARFNKPSDVAVDAAGNIYVADSGNHAIRKISINGTVSTLAGKMGAAGNTNASGSSARFRSPQGIAVDASGSVYVADTGNQQIRRITANGTVSTFAGAAFTGSASPLGGRASFTGSAHAAFIGSADSANLPASVDGNATTARFSYPTDITIDAAGNLYVTDSGTEKIRKITANGTVTTLGGSPDGFFFNPLAVAAGANGTLYIADAGNNRIARGQIGNTLPPSILSFGTLGNMAFSAYNTLPTPTLTVVADTMGSSSLKYQWRFNGSAISGATQSTYNPGAASAAKVGNYSVVVSNTANQTTASANLSFVLKPAASFTIAGPVNQQLAAGANATFSVGNLSLPPGATAIYKWYWNGVVIPAASGPAYKIPGGATASTAGIYSVEVTSKIGSTVIGAVASNSWALSFIDPGILIYTLSGNSIQTIGSNETTGAISGYFVLDRKNNNAAIIQTYGTGASKRNSLEMREDIAAASTGPIAGSRTVFAGSLNSGNSPVDHEIAWITGRDTELVAAPATSTAPILPAITTFAPSSMTGVLGTLVRNGKPVGIDSYNVTLTLNTTLTAASYRGGQTFNQAITATRAAATTAGYPNQETNP